MMDRNTGNLTRENPENYNFDPRILDVHAWAYGVLSPVIISVGVVGNLLTILILMNPKFKAGVTYKYFLILAASDLVALLFSVSVFVHIIHEATLVYATAVWYSYLEDFLANVPLSTSVFTVICITIDRFYSICRPTKFSTIHNEKFARKALLGSLILSVIVWLPVCFLKTPVEVDDCESSYFVPPDNRTWWVACMVHDTLTEPLYLVYSWGRQTIVTFIPLVLMIVLNIMTIKEFIRVSKKRKEMKNNSVLSSAAPTLSSATEVTHSHDRNLIRLLFAVVVTFFITMVPAGVFNAMYSEYLTSDFEYEVFRALANDLEILNHALNFYMYILCSSQIRLTCRALIRRCFSCSSSVSAFACMQHPE
nr:probable G-protein coupled receptor B0563.6 isoform X1 [Cherax quadricarinatus]XP_053649928.1 probable G-protein coupled receptor B0563.6 isoform X1 [Cherax quadricarinatus]XP_053649937.1 probable G-protein coupled receptor B0563.6 isoform X1 [Cherax quadricarinatus]